MGAQLDRIITEGTRDSNYSTKGKPSNNITCADGFKLSVIAGGGAYSSPREGGDYDAVEVGFLSVQPEPWETWDEYAEAPDAPTETVYRFVPVEHVRALLDLHGGEA